MPHPPFLHHRTLIVVAACALAACASPPAADRTMTASNARPDAPADAFGPSNPFHAASVLPFQAPPFDRIHDTDYLPALEAGMAAQRQEIAAIVANPDAPTFDNTYVAMERSGALLRRVNAVFDAVVGANTDPALQEVESAEAPRLSAHTDAIELDPRLYARIDAVYQQRDALNLAPEARRLVEVVHQRFVHAGANLSEADKAKLKDINNALSTLGNTFSNQLLAATKAAAYATTDPGALAGLSDGQRATAALAAKERGLPGEVLPLQNTTQQPLLASLNVRATRQALYDNSWLRAERGDANDTRATIAKMAQLRAQKAALLGKPDFAAWTLENQMAQTPEAALTFLGQLVPKATAKARREAADIQTAIDADHGGFKVAPWDWDHYAEKVRKARYDFDDAEVRPYFELDRVLKDGVFYAASQLYGITFTERHDLPVWHPDVRVFEVREADGRPLALFYADYWKRDNKSGGAWMSNLVGQSRLEGTLPVVYNVANLQKPAPGQPALISLSDVRTMFHEMGHALHGMFSDSTYPTLSGTDVPRDYVEFPSQFNEHWATEPKVFAHYARHHLTGAPMPTALVEKLRGADTFNQGYSLTELLAASQIDLHWHSLPPTAALQAPDEFEAAVLQTTGLDLPAVPPRYRSSYFAHIWRGGYAAGYYAYQWAEMIDHNAYQWFEDHGGLTRANGDRFRRMVLSRGNTEELNASFQAWLGKAPEIGPMLKYRGLDGAN